MRVTPMHVTPTNREIDGSVHNYSDSDSSSNSPSSHGGGVAGSNCSGTNFSFGRSSSSGTSYSGNISEEEDGGLNDWEAVADALAAADDKQKQKNHELESPIEYKNVAELDPLPEVVNRPASGVDLPKSRPVNSQAWRPNDAFRPQSLPNLVKQNSFPMKSIRQYGHGGTAWVCKKFVSAPSSCPICCEDLDITDSSFLPCSCGFQLCLFCHKRILEEDGRCPGCRKHYDNDVLKGGGNSDLGGSCALRLDRSSSMITRS